MRTLWIMVSTLAIANLLAISCFVAWLGVSGRLSGERVEAMRETFKLTVAQERIKEEEAEAARQLEARALEESAREGMPPLTAEHQLALSSSMTEVAERRLDRMAREAQDLRDAIVSEREELDRQREVFDARVREFELRRAQIVEQEGSEQFRKAVDLYRSMKPPAATAMMASLVRDGEIETVVAYLDALPTRTSAKIVAEFEKQDASLAADLLERVRQRGTAFDFNTAARKDSTS